MAWEAGMEPELKSSPPRIVHSRWSAKFTPGLFLTLGLGAALLFGCVAYFAQKKHNALRDHGTPITASLVRLEPRHGKTGPYLHYAYVVAGQTHGYADSVSQSEFDAAKLGQSLELVYLPESPGSAETAAEVKQGDWSTGAIVSAIVGPIFGLIMFVAWWFVSRSQGRKRRLACDGLPVWTSAHEILLTRSSPKYDQYKIRYEYVVDGVRRENTTTVNGAAMQALALEGSRSSVLYDPLDPAQSELYPAVTQLYRIENTG
jgi:hypothetical protein